MLFLNQGPIYTPLILVAILAVATRPMPLWLGSLFVMLASFYAVKTRVTWMFAAGIWAALIAFIEVSPRGVKTTFAALAAGDRFWRFRVGREQFDPSGNAADFGLHQRCFGKGYNRGWNRSRVCRTSAPSMGSLATEPDLPAWDFARITDGSGSAGGFAFDLWHSPVET